MGMVWGSGQHPVDISVREHHKAIKARTMRKYKPKATPAQRKEVIGMITSGRGGMKGYSKYAAEGKGLTDAARRLFATILSGDEYRDYTTYLHDGVRKARGSWQVAGHTEESLLRGGKQKNAIKLRQDYKPIDWTQFFGGTSTLGSNNLSSGITNMDLWRIFGKGKGLGLPPEKKDKIATLAILSGAMYMMLGMFR